MGHARFVGWVVVACAAWGCGDNGNSGGGGGDAGTLDGGGRDAAADAAPDAPPGAITLTIVTPTANAIVTGSRTVTVTGTIASSEAISSVTIAVGSAAGSAATFDQTSFSSQVVLADNANTITVIAAGSDGAGSSAQVAVSYPFVEISDFEAATVVLGQPDGATDTHRKTDASSVAGPFGDPVSVGGALFVPSALDDRVVVYNGFPTNDNQRADFALGQRGLASVTTVATARTFDEPGSVATDGVHMVVMDHFHNRALIYNTIPTAVGASADIVLGQASFTSTTAGCSPTSFGNQPSDVQLVGGKLIISDVSNSRVLIWNALPTANDTPPDLVLGQADFTHCAANDDNQDGSAEATPTARTLSSVSGAWSDGTRLAVVDQGNSRVLIWNTFPTASFTPADYALGQASVATNGSAAGASGMNQPRMIDSNGNQLVVCDEQNNRVLIWDSFPTTMGQPADHVLGQGDFQHIAINDDNQDGVADATSSRRTMQHPRGARFVDGTLVIADGLNNRALVFGPTPCPANTGEIEAPAGTGTCVADPCTATTCGAEVGANCVHDATGSASCPCEPGFDASCTVCVRFAAPTATSAGDGLDWSDVAPLSGALTSAGSGAGSSSSCEVWAEGTTYFTRNTAATDTFSVPAGVALRGGFAGDEGEASQRHGSATILDGRTSATNSAAANHVITASGAGTVTLDRLTIQDGSASGTGTSANGGGVLVTNGSIAITACTMIANSAVGVGGAISIGTGGSATIDGSTFTGNAAAQSGGAISASAGSFAITGSTFTANSCCTTTNNGGGAVRTNNLSTISGSTFRDNVSGDSAGAIEISGATSEIETTQLIANRSNFGGAVMFVSSTAGVVSDSLIAGNTSTGAGGGVVVNGGFVTFVSSTITGNVAPTGGGAVRFFTGSGAFEDDIVFANAAPTGRAIDNGSFTTDASDVQDNLGSGNGSFDADPQFVVAPVLWDEVSQNGSDDQIVLPTGLEGTIAVGDIVVIGDDGVERTVTATNGGGEIIFTPALPALAVAGESIVDWGPTPASVVADFHLGDSSPCIDAADGSVAPATDLDGVSRVDDPNVPNTGTGVPAFADIGCFEHP